MTDRTWCTVGCALLTMALAGRGEAQPLVILPDHRTVGGSLARSDNADENSNDSSPDIAATLELPLSAPFRVRFEAGRVAWQFGGHTAERISPSDTVTLRRLTVSLVKVVVPASIGYRMSGYLGTGVGVYHYGFRRGRGAVPIRRGVHGLAGLEYALADSPIVLGWECQLHIVRGPNDSPVQSRELFVLQASMNVKYRF